ncbi:MAG: RNA 2',3'-cyclic phosphodiesterase [Gemmatimonadetes bacterium]|nr:RNA 2',3'-cyclic phosphodiesterase [Gemmatimonadota bacterium]
MRAFVAVPLPLALVPAYADLQGALRLPGRVRWVEPASLHLTLRFLGSVPAADVPALAEALSRAASSSSPATLVGVRLDAFPSPRAPRVIVVELEDAAAALPRLHVEIERELTELGFPAQGRDFRMHVTLGRLAGDKMDVRAALAGAAPPAAVWPVDGFELVRSDLGQGPPRYTTLARFALGSAGRG